MAHIEKYLIRHINKTPIKIINRSLLKRHIKKY